MKPPSPSIPQNSETPPEQVLKHLQAPRPSSQPLPPKALPAAISLLQSPTTPAPTLSAILTALIHLPPSKLPASETTSLATALAAAARRALPVLTPTDLFHVTTLITQLAARNDKTALQTRKSRAATTLLRLASPAASAHPALREALRRLAIISALPAHNLSSRHLVPTRRKRPLRILALDGGGTRAVLPVQMLRRLEQLLHAPLRNSFDLIAGTSSGAVLAFAVGLLGMSPAQCEELCMRFASDVFSSRRGTVLAGNSSSTGIYQAGKVLLFNRGMYDIAALRALYENRCGPARLYEHAGGNGTPRVFALSTQIRSCDATASTPRPFLHANYHLRCAEGRRPRYAHGCLHRLSEALTASTAAPIYFDAFVDDEEAFCDGGVVVNNPAAVAIHEARQLWPDRPLGVVVSLGTGLFTGDAPVAQNGTNGVQLDVESRTTRQMKKVGTLENDTIQGRGKMAMRVAQAVVQSATDTESVHHTLEDLIESDDVYFRLNPEVAGEQVPLDESREDILQRLIDVGRAYVAESGAGAERMARLAGKLNEIGRQGGSVYGLWRFANSRSYARL